LTSIIWVGLHVQYGIYELVQIFLLGLMLGAMRVKTGSVIPAIVCHVLGNVIATTEAAIVTST
jgi:membrane protease YdiL (CAAX protease family)